MFRTQGRHAGDSRQVPLLLGLEPVGTAKRLAERLVWALHENLHGACEGLGGRRSAAYLRQQLRGLHPITVEDLAELAAGPTREARDAARAFALELLAATEPTSLESLLAAAAEFAREAGDVAPAVLDAEADGSVSEAEALRITREVHESQKAGMLLLARLAQVRG